MKKRRKNESTRRENAKRNTDREKKVHNNKWKRTCAGTAAVQQHLLMVASPRIAVCTFEQWELKNYTAANREIARTHNSVIHRPDSNWSWSKEFASSKVIFIIISSTNIFLTCLRPWRWNRNVIVMAIAGCHNMRRNRRISIFDDNRRLWSASVWRWSFCAVFFTIATGFL